MKLLTAASLLAAAATVTFASPVYSQAWKNCVVGSIGPGGCDSIAPGGGKSIAPGGGQSIGPGGGLSIAPGGGRSIAPGGGQSIGPGGGLSIAPGGGLAADRDWSRGFDMRTGQPAPGGVAPSSGYRPAPQNYNQGGSDAAAIGTLIGLGIRGYQKHRQAQAARRAQDASSAAMDGAISEAETAEANRARFEATRRAPDVEAPLPEFGLDAPE